MPRPGSLSFVPCALQVARSAAPRRVSQFGEQQDTRRPRPSTCTTSGGAERHIQGLQGGCRPVERGDDLLTAAAGTNESRPAHGAPGGLRSSARGKDQGLVMVNVYEPLPVYDVRAPVRRAASSDAASS
jgi:hypothetical protein